MANRRKAPRWRRGFLRALARTGNVRVAAEWAGVDHSSAYYQRARDAGFAKRWARAAEAGKARVEAGMALGESPLHHSPAASGPPHSDPKRVAHGEDLIVRKSKREGVQLVRAWAGRWAPAAEERFFEELLDSGNVRRACTAAGFSTVAIYYRRATYADFAARWEAALDTAHARLDMFLVEAATRTFDVEAIKVPDEIPRVTVSEAIAIRRLRPPGARRGVEAYEPPIEEVRASILAKIEAIEAAEAGEKSPSL